MQTDKNRQPHLYASPRTLFILCAIVIVLAAGIFFLVENLSPRTYEDSVLSVTYPPNWKTVAPDRMTECAQQPEGRRCLVVLVRAPDYLTKIIIIQQDLPSATTLEAAEAAFWNRLTSRANVTLERGTSLTLDNQPAMLRQYAFEFEGSSGYEQSITLLDGQTLYQVFANAEDRDVLLKDMPEIQGILDTLQFNTAG